MFRSLSFATLTFLVCYTICSAHPDQSIIACEHANAFISCKGGDTIVILWANYGRMDKTTCATTQYPLGSQELEKTDCFAANSISIVKAKCNGKQSCFVPASNQQFRDPCVYTYKYLDIHYICEPSGLHPKQHE